MYLKLLQKLASSSRSTIEGIFLADKNQNAVAGITISKAAAIKLPIIPTAELFATSAEKSAASNKFEI